MDNPKFETSVKAITATENEDQGQNPSSQRSTNEKTTTTTVKQEIELPILLKFIKPYNGSRNKLNSFLLNCDNAYELASDEQQVILFKYILCQLRGEAETACSIKQFTNWQQLREFLKTHFSERKHYAYLLTDLQECEQQKDETVSQYALRIEACLSQLITEISILHGHKSDEMVGRTATMEELALHQFLIGLTPRISDIVRSKPLTTLNEAINMAISEEQSLLKQGSILIKNSHDDKQNTTRLNSNISNLFCRCCKAPGHTIEQCRKREFNNNHFSDFYQKEPMPQGLNFVVQETLVSNNDRSPIDSEEGYDTVDGDSENVSIPVI